MSSVKTLRAQIQLGVNALDRGDANEIDDSELERYLKALAAEARTPAVAVRLRRK
jgi:hypothetical protein